MVKLKDLTEEQKIRKVIRNMIKEVIDFDPTGS
jgi:hypothetical protein